MSKTSLRLLSRVALPVLAAACAGPALAQTVEGSGNAKVMMFERPPSVDELRDVVGTPQAPAAGQEQGQEQADPACSGRRGRHPGIVPALIPARRPVFPVRE